MKRRRLPYGPLGWLSLLLCLAPPAASSVAERLHFRHVTVDDGLTNNWVLAIVKDSVGFLWFGTNKGLNRYDGSRLVTYRHEPGNPDALPAAMVTALFEDSRRQLWVGVRGSNAVALYDRERERFRSISIDSSPLEPSNFDVNHICEDRSGRMWFAGANGLHVLDPKTGSITSFWKPSDVSGEVPSNAVFRLVVSASGDLWVAAAAGLYRVDPHTGAATRWSARLDGVEVPAATGVVALHLDDDGLLWFIGDGFGLVRLDTRTREAKRYGPASLGVERPRRLAGDGQHRLYVGSEDGGLSVLDTHTETFTRYAPDPADPDALSAASIWATYLDDQGLLWIGTFNGGVNYATPFGQRFGLLRSGRGRLSSPNITVVLEDRNGNLWIGTDGGGLDHLDRKSGRFTYFRRASGGAGGLASDAVLALHEDARGQIWVGTYAGGLQSLDPRSGRFTSYPDKRVGSVWAMVEGPDHRLFVVTLQEVLVLDRLTGRFTPLLDRVSDSNPTLNAITVDSAGGLWISHGAGAEYVDPRTSTVTPYLSGTGVLAVFLDSRGNVWFGTGSKGLHCRAKDGTLRSYAMADGLPSDNVVALQEDGEGHLWVATTRGLAKMENGTQVPRHPRFVLFDTHDGLQGDEFRRGASLKTRAGELFFGGQRGLSHFFPADVRLNLQPPPVVLTGVRIFDQPTPFVGKADVALAPDASMVTFEFAALDYAAPPKNRYRHKLEGFDRDWSPVSAEATATYTNLPPGRYTFQVQAANNDGAWNTEGASLALRRTARFYETGMFTVTLAIAVAASAFGLHRLRVLSHVRTEHELETGVAEAMAQVKTLSGLVSVCAWCKKAQDDSGYWSQLEAYVQERSEAEFAESLCPSCTAQHGATSVSARSA